ncbi:MAG: CHAT domain-containing protein [Planctomycetes bacterium]|nr:CHAT domain-containing protein [Planctomycetota bacterium]
MRSTKADYWMSRLAWITTLGICLTGLSLWTPSTAQGQAIQKSKVPSIPGRPTGTPYDFTAARTSINKLANDGKLAEAIAEAKKNAGRPGASADDRELLRMLEEEQNLRARANALRDENRIDDAIKTADQALTLRDKRNQYRLPRSIQDTQWVTNLKNTKTLSESGLSPRDLQQILLMEYQDKWFDYKLELHDGGEMAEAIAKSTKSLAETRADKGADHPDTLAAKAVLEKLQSERARLLEDLRKTMSYRDEIFARGDYQEAIGVEGSCIKLKQQIYGIGDLTVAISLAERARMEQKAGNWSMAEHYFGEALKAFTALYGPEHWRTRDAKVAAQESEAVMNNLETTRNLLRDSRWQTFKARKLLEKGYYFEALKLMDQDERQIRFHSGDQFTYYALNQLCLAAIYRAMGRFSEAEIRQRRALDILQKCYGDNHPEVVSALNTLYQLYRDLGDTSLALTTARRSVVLTERVWGKLPSEFAISLNNLGEAELALGHVDQARPLFVQSLKLCEQDFAKLGLQWTASLQNLAQCHRTKGETAECARLLTNVVKNFTSGYGKGHPKTVDAMFALAEAETDSRNFPAAEAGFKAVLEASRLVYGPNHPKQAEFTSGQARMWRARGEDAKAEPMLRDSLEILRANMDSTFAVLSERRQLAMTRNAQRLLHEYIDLAVAIKLPGDAAYGTIVSWKGAVLNQQKQLRLGLDQPELASLYGRYQEASRELATLALATPLPSEHDVVASKIDELSQSKERLEGELSQKSNSFRTSREPFTVETLKKLLPPDSALVDFVEFSGSVSQPATAGPPKQRLVAFIVCPDKPVQQIDLGDAVPIRTLCDLWRGQIMRGQGAVGRGLKVLPPKDATPDKWPHVELRKRIWEPLEAHLSDTSLVMISPDGITARLPFAAMPGRDSSRYLIEDISLVVVPSPSQLASLLIPQSADNSDAMSMLVMGDVDFGASAGSAAPSEPGEALVAQRSAPRFANAVFSPLPGTGREVNSIADLFREHFSKGVISELQGAEATEGKLREAGPRHRYLHLATHGFFVPELVAAGGAKTTAAGAEKITDLNPGLLSGIALAGANPKPGNSALGNAQMDDGVMTALEVASLDLSHIDLAVLSACETGLGLSAGGEGLLGLQRSFQAAGARSTVASLWKVDDSATQVLMIEFYRNMWDKKLGKLEALRQAQLTMIQQYDSREQKLTARGLKAVAPDSEPGPLAPYYWAAFMLSGDWR